MRALIIPFLLLTFLTINIQRSFSQNIPNGNFENWTGVEPDNWVTFNILAQFGAPLTTTPAANAISGNYGVRLESATFLNQITNTIDSIAGMAISGSPGAPGLPFTYRPDSMVFWYKYMAPPGDTALVYLQLTKWHSVTSFQELIGEIGALLPTQTNVWVRKSYPVTFHSAGTPDSVVVGMISRANQFYPGTVLEVDSIHFVYLSSGYPDWGNASEMKVYPNPASDQIKIIGNHLKTGSVMLIENAIGEEVIRIVWSPELTIDVKGLIPGIYSVRNLETNNSPVRFIRQ